MGKYGIWQFNEPVSDFQGLHALKAIQHQRKKLINQINQTIH